MAAGRKLSEGRRTELLEAAVRVISERGLCDTRISDVAERAGASSALVIYYFKTKDQLLTEALTYAEERFYTQTLADLSGIERAGDRLVRLIELSCSPDSAATQAWIDEWVLWLDLWARAPRDPEVARKREALDQRWRGTIADIVREGQAAGEFAPVDADDFAVRLASLLDGLAVQVVLRDAEVTAQRMYDIALRMVTTELGVEATEVRPLGGGRKANVASRSR